MTEFLSNLIGNEYLATLIMSFIPLIELKGGIIYAQSAGIHWLVSLLLAYLGSTIVFIPIYFLLKPILALLKKIKWFNGFALKIEGYFQNKASKTLGEQQTKNKKSLSGDALKKLGVFLFVAIPLPMTGVWTGTAIAVFLDLKFKDVILPITLGNLVAGILILILSLVCSLIGISLDLVLYVLFALAIVLLIVVIVKVALTKTEKGEQK